MKFRVGVRPFSAHDVSLECPYQPTWEEYAQELELLIREVNEIPQCNSATVDGDAIYIDAKFDNVRDMQNGLKSIFSEHICFVRFVDAEIWHTDKR